MQDKVVQTLKLNWQSVRKDWLITSSLKKS